MKIRPKNIPTFQNGGVPLWYLDRYGNRTALLNWNSDLDYSSANQNLNTNDHRNAGNLDTVYRKNLAYTRTPGAINSDIQTFYNSDGNGMSAEDFVNFYNKNAEEIRKHWSINLTYKAPTAGKHNQLFRRMFASRSALSQSPGSDYNIGYQNNLENIEGSSTWLRRMDLYENEFDPNNPDSNRIHDLILSDGTKVQVYKKANGDIGLINAPTQESLLKEDSTSPTNPSNEVPAVGGKKYGFDWGKLREGAQKILSNPDLYATGRLIGTLNNNERVYDEALKGINPVLKLSYHTHRQVVGDEATKQAYYRRAVLGEQRAARPMTSDASIEIARRNEAKRIGDELRALGDLADNQEIRRTSDESNQHQWANTLRDTEVANANIASMAQANSLKHNLLALKHAAQWSSIDNFLQGIEYRKRLQNAEELALEDLLFLMDLQNVIYSKEYLDAYKKYLDVRKRHSDRNGNVDETNEEVRKAALEWNLYLSNIRRKAILDQLNRKRSVINFWKEGSKVTHKKKDDLLYKSARDIVEHFRKMSKISSDALNRKQPKIEKLAPHPKGHTKKYLLGGVAPFTIYKPVALGGETTTSSQTSSSSTKSKGNDTLDMIKELFKEVVGKGLPSDVNSLYASMRSFLDLKNLFGSEISTEDIASMYLSLMLRLNQILYLKGEHDRASQAMVSNDSTNEIAVDFAGRLVGQNKDGEIVYLRSLAEANEKGIRPLTNELLLQLRAIDPSLAGRLELDTIVANGVGMTKIASHIKSLIPQIGTDTIVREGYTKVQAGQIEKGLESLLSGAPDGYYETTQSTESLKKLRALAIEFIKKMLPNNMRRVLDVHAEYSGASPDALIEAMVGAGESFKHSLTFKAATGQAAKDANGKSNGKGGTDTPASVLFLLGNGYLEIVEFNIGNSLSVKALGRFGILLDKEKNNLGQGSNLLDVSKSLFGPILDLDKATFGGTRLVSSGYSHIILNNSDCIGVDLPVKKDLSGNYVPDFLQLAIIEKAEEKIHNSKITNPQQINQVYREFGLPDKFDSNGNIIQLNYRRFAGILVILDSKALKGGIPINANEISEADDEERELFIEEMKKNGNKDYDLSDGILWSSWGRDKLYKGTIFVPVREDIAAGYTSGGSPLDTDIPNNANLVALMLYAPKTQQYLKTPPLSALK